MTQPKTSRAILTLLALCVPILIHAASPSSAIVAAKFISYWQLAENQLNIPHGGRANTIAIRPLDPDEILVASESGGLFKSVDRGSHWTHVDSLPVYRTMAVAYLPSNPDILFVTALNDFKSTNGGGVWRSTNGGATWSHPQLMAPGFSGRLDGFEISIRPSDETIFVATSRGLFSSSDTGLTWTYSAVFESGSRDVRSVLATSTMLLAAGTGGLRRWDTSQAFPRWVTVAGNLGSTDDLHALGGSPLSPSHAFVVNSTSALFRTEDGGVTWTQITLAPMRDPMARCGGIAFIKAVRRTFDGTPYLHLYYGNRCWLHRLITPINSSGTTANYFVPWLRSEIDHPDTRDLAFIGNQPFLLGTDGGLHKSADGGYFWWFSGGGRAGGFNALQVTEVKGQLIESTGVTDIYLGTQDNNLWSSNIFGNIYREFGAEGFYVEAERRVAFPERSKIAFVSCGGCQNQFSDRHFDGSEAWNNAPGAPPTPVSAPAVIRNSVYVQGVDVSKSLEAGLALTDDAGTTWRQFAPFAESRRDLPKLARSGEGDPFMMSIVYQPYRAAFSPTAGEVVKLMRIHKRDFTAGNGTVFFPTMTGFGGLGINPTMFVAYQIYGVDSGNPFHVIAPDVIGRRMMETRNGGETWTEIPGLTDLVTDGGRLRFATDLSGGSFNTIFPLVTAVSFSPQNPNLVLIGTSEGGIFRSNDNGATWKKIDDTDRVTYITSFFWETANSVHISTYGRGMWKLRNRKIALPTAFDEFCGTACDVVANGSGPGRPPFNGGILVYEGTILGAKTSGGVLKEVFVRPGSSVVFIGDEDDPQWDITVTEAESVDPKELEPLPEPPKGWITKGLVFTDGDKLTGTVFGDSVMTLVPPPTKEDYGGSTESPTKGKPYVRLTTSVLPGQTLDLTATDFIPEETYELFIDGEPAKITVTADRTGAFAATLTAPETFGYHVVEVRDRENVIDGSTFLVKHGD